MANQLQTMHNAQKAQLTPVLISASGSEMNWTEALDKYSAAAEWDGDNAANIGVVTTDAVGIGTFTPNATGSGTIKCIVTYMEPDTRAIKTLEQILEITVIAEFTPTGMTLVATIVPQ